MTDHDADVVVVGSGPSGATVADVLTGLGRTVIVLERGRNLHLLQLEPPLRPARPRRTTSSSRCTATCSAAIRSPSPARSGAARPTATTSTSATSTRSPPPWAAAGARRRQAPRLREVDFRLRSERGPVAGADVVDWPLTYADLEPYYAETEVAVGVAGEETNLFAAWRSTPFPMAPGPDMWGPRSPWPPPSAGLHPYRPPTGINSVPYDGRPACNNCGFCAFHARPIDAKGDPVSLLRRAPRTGRCEIRPESYVTEVVLDGTGRRATGVRYLDADRGPRRCRPSTWCWPPERSRRRGYCARASATRRARWAATSCTTSRRCRWGLPHSMHGARGRSVTAVHDDHIEGDEAAARAAREAGLP
ncbi:MAG: hypothetical protein R2746_00265 [Acidimicrobiales bacterium]